MSVARDPDHEDGDDEPAVALERLGQKGRLLNSPLLFDEADHVAFRVLHLGDGRSAGDVDGCITALPPSVRVKGRRS